MITKFWQVIRDDTKRTYEVYGQDSNTNYFTNSIHGMQKAKMTVTGMTPPVGGKYSNKKDIVISGYTVEDGLFDRLVKEYNDMQRKLYDHL